MASSKIPASIQNQGQVLGSCFIPGEDSSLSHSQDRNQLGSVPQSAPGHLGSPWTQGLGRDGTAWWQPLVLCREPPPLLPQDLSGVPSLEEQEGTWPILALRRVSTSSNSEGETPSSFSEAASTGQTATITRDDASQVGVTSAVGRTWQLYETLILPDPRRAGLLPSSGSRKSSSNPRAPDILPGPRRQRPSPGPPDPGSFTNTTCNPEPRLSQSEFLIVSSP